MATTNMQLDSSFTYEGWNIKYKFAEPQTKTHASRKIAVFVHGTPWSSDVFVPLAQSILARERYGVLLYDLPGYGHSQELQNSNASQSKTSRFKGDTSVKFQGAALAGLLSHLGIDGKEGNPAPAMIAHDIAGTIALRTHLIHGCQFDSLLMMDTNTVLPWGDGFYKLVRSEPDTFLKLPSNIFESMVRAVVRSACFNPKTLDSGWEDALARPWIRSSDESDSDAPLKQMSFVRQIAQANDEDVAEMLNDNMYERVRCDVKILWGENDQWIPREKMDRLASMLKHRLKEFVVVPESGHLVMIDQPSRVAIEVFSWLAEH